LFILLFGFAALKAESWTVLVYMAADNNLAQMGKLDINTMESASQPAGLNLIVQADFPEGAARYKIQPDNSTNITSPVLTDLGAIDSGNPQTLNSFIKWGFNRYPSQRKMLVIWSHGDSWYKKDDGKWICPDDGAENLMSIANGDLKIAFAGTPKLNILLFDACSMQSIEVIQEVAEYADYVIGSEELVPVYGFPYETMIPLFSENIELILTQIPELYVQSYLPGAGINPGEQLWTTTCSVIDTALMLSFHDIFIPALHYFWPVAESIMPIRQKCYEMNTGLADVDIKQFIMLLREMDPNAVHLSSLQYIWTNMVVSSAFTSPDTSVENIGTAALWFPDSRYNFSNGWQRYQKLKFADTEWLTLINMMLIDDIPPDKPSLQSQSIIYSTLYLHIQPPADPDWVYYRLKLTGSGHIEDFCPGSLWADSFLIQISISGAGSYQLWAIDRSENFSEAITGSYDWTEPQVSMFLSPNPVRGKDLATLYWWTDANISGQARLEIYNLKGQMVIKKQLGEVITGENRYLLSAESKFHSLPAGRYFLRLKLGSKYLSSKLTILY